MEKKRVSILVAGQRFNLITDQEEKYVRELASHIDARITSASISGNMTRESAAVLTALDLADDGEKCRREIGEIKEQIKDYLARIETLSAENEELKAELSKAQLSVSALDDARATLAGSDREKQALKNEIAALKEQIELMQRVGYTLPAEQEDQELPAREPEAQEQAPLPGDESAPAEYLPEEEHEQTAAPVQERAASQPVITAEDDLFFDPQQEEPVRPSRKEKKNRHEHKHDNPYKQQFMKQQGEPKGYTQQRQYSLFDVDEQD